MNFRKIVNLFNSNYFHPLFFCSSSCYRYFCRVYSKDEIKQLNASFWTGFQLFCSKQKYLKGRRRMWKLHKTKVNHVHFRFEPGRENVQVMLEVLHRSEEQRLDV